MEPSKNPCSAVCGASRSVGVLALCLLLWGCASTPEQKEAADQRRTAKEQRKLAEEQRKADKRQKYWQQKLATFSDEQLRFKFAALEQEIASGRQGVASLLAQGNGLGVAIGQGIVDGKVRERDAVGMELARRMSGSRSATPGAVQEENDGTRVRGTGTGFFITEDGFFVTCHHLVENASRVDVQTKAGRLPAKLIRADKENDLAILKVDGVFAMLPLVSSAPVKLGQSVLTIGFPNPAVQGLEPKLTRGDISSLAGVQDDPRHFQISVAVQPGNSGGPLINEAGNVVGVVVARLSDIKTLKRTGSLPQNVNYAVKSSLLNMVLESVPDVAGRLKEPHPERERKSEDVASEAQTAVAIVVAY